MPLTLNPLTDQTTPDLVSQDRAMQNPTLATVYANNPGFFTSLLTAASDAIRRYCHRDFTTQSYVEYYSGTPNQRALRLRQFPIQSVTRIGIAVPCIQVQNSGAAYQRATVRTTSSGIVLFAVNSGVPVNVNLLYSAYPTVQAIGNAITALPNGWNVAIQSGSYGSFALFPSADLRVMQGATTALNGGVFLEIYEELMALGTYGWGAGDGDEVNGGWQSGCGWRLDENTGELFASNWPRGEQRIRVDYTAGFAEVPSAVQEATVQHAKDLYRAATLNTTLGSERLGDWSASYIQKLPPMSGIVTGLIQRYVAPDKVISHS